MGLLLEGERSKNWEAAERVRIWSAERGGTGVPEVVDVGNWRVLGISGLRLSGIGRS